MRRGRRYSEMMLERRLAFREEFAEELSMGEFRYMVPEWVVSTRELLLDKISNPVKQIGLILKSAGVCFKFRWPLRVDGRWKFADIYIPSTDTVVMVSSRKELVEPSLFADERACFFEKEHNVCALPYDCIEGDHERIISLLN